MSASKTLSAPPELLKAIEAEAEHLGELEALLLTLQRFQLDAAAGVVMAGIRAQLLTLQAAAESLEQLDLMQLSLVASDDLSSCYQKPLQD
jgi:hypothetical protein